MFTLDDVDWNQIPPDNNTGIQFPVQLAVDGGLTGSNAHVVENKTANVTSRPWYRYSAHQPRHRPVGYIIDLR
jgi:hypothetical protein